MSRKFSLKNSRIYIILIAILLIYMFPVYLVVINSFKNLFEIIDNTLGFPRNLHFKNYIQAFNDMNYPMAFMNSVIVTVFSVIVVCFFPSMTAHYFLRNKSKFNTLMFGLMIASMNIPFHAIMIPMVRIYGSLGVLNNKASLIYFYLAFGTPLSVFTYHGFMKSIPKELEEAAVIDGCNKIQTFFKVVFPLLTPVTASIATLNILWFWNDYLLPFLVLKKAEQRTLPLSTFAFFGTHSADYGLLMAALIMTVIPIVIVYVFLQKYIIQGIVQGAVKY